MTLIKHDIADFPEDEGGEQGCGCIIAIVIIIAIAALWVTHWIVNSDVFK